MKCYKTTAGCGVYENRSCSECPYSKPPKPKCNTCALESCCSISNSNLSYNCPTYTEEDDNVKRIKQIIVIAKELLGREYTFNCIMEGTWNELCDEAIQYLEELKNNYE